MNWHSTRVASGNTRYPLEHTLEDQGAKLSTLPKSQQFADTTATLGVASRGFHFTGRTTASDNHDEAIHSDSSLLYDNRDNNEVFVEARNGAQSNPAFKDPPVPAGSPVPSGVMFTPSQAEPAAQGGQGPSWWDRLTSNARKAGNTQSTNLAEKPPEKFQVGLRSSNAKVEKQNQKQTKESGLMTNTGVIGSMST